MAASLADTAAAGVEGAQRALVLVNAVPLSAASASRRRIVVADDNWDTLFEFPF
jgi:hypothetical protein